MHKVHKTNTDLKTKNSFKHLMHNATKWLYAL